MMTWLKLPFGLLGAFLHWWLAELAGLIPRGLRRPLSGRGETIILEPSYREVTESYRNSSVIRATISSGQSRRSPGANSTSARIRRGRASSSRHSGRHCGDSAASSAPK